MDTGRVHIVFQRASEGGEPLQNGFLIRVGKAGGESPREIWVTIEEAARLNRHLTALFGKQAKAKAHRTDEENHRR